MNQTGELLPADELLPLIEEMIQDPRLVGYAQFIRTIKIMWSDAIQTACAGHGFIFFNKPFFYSIPPETRITVMVHEIKHLALDHLNRSKGMNHNVFNIAADHVINIDTQDEGFTFEGTEPYLDEKYRGMSMERVYGIIYEDEDNPPPPMPGLPSRDQIEDLIEKQLVNKVKLLSKPLKRQKVM